MVGLAAVAAFCCVAAPAAATAPALTGETFSNATGSISFTSSGGSGFSCAGPGSGTTSFDATGSAMGPYRGTFDETGSGPFTVSATGAFSWTFDATFTVTNSGGVTTVSGSKHVTATGQCPFPFAPTVGSGTYTTTAPGGSGTTNVTFASSGGGFGGFTEKFTR